MNSLFPGVKDIEMVPPAMTLTFDRDVILPKLGEIMSDENQYNLLVTKVNEEDHSVEIVVHNALPLKERVLQQREALLKKIESLSSALHKDTSIGMLGLLSWEQLEKDQQDKYILAVLNLISILEKDGFIKYGPHDL